MFKIKEQTHLIYMPQAKFDSQLYLQNVIQVNGGNKDIAESPDA